MCVVDGPLCPVRCGVSTLTLGPCADSFDHLTGQLQPREHVPLGDAAGPRHMAFHPSGSHAFVLNELANTVTVLAYDAATGRLTSTSQHDSVTCLADDEGSTRPPNRGGSAEICVSPDGSQVWATVRLGRNAEPMHAFPTHPFDVEYNLVASFDFDDEAESLTLRSNVSCGGSMPWGCCLASAGDVLLIQNQFSRFETGKGAGVGPGRLTALDVRRRPNHQPPPDGPASARDSAQPLQLLQELEHFMCLATSPAHSGGVRYIDAHSHVWTTDVAAYPLLPGVRVGDSEAGWTVHSWTGEELLAVAAPSGVGRAVLIGHGLIYGYDNTYMLACCRAHPDRFRVVAQIDDRLPGIDSTMRDLLHQGNTHPALPSRPTSARHTLAAYLCVLCLHVRTMHCYKESARVRRRHWVSTISGRVWKAIW